MYDWYPNNYSSRNQKNNIKMFVFSCRPALAKFDKSLKGTISKATRDKRCPKSVVKNYKYLYEGMKKGYEYLCGKGLDSKS